MNTREIVSQVPAYTGNLTAKESSVIAKIFHKIFCSRIYIKSKRMRAIYKNIDNYKHHIHSLRYLSYRVAKSLLSAEAKGSNASIVLNRKSFREIINRANDNLCNMEDYILRFRRFSSVIIAIFVVVTALVSLVQPLLACSDSLLLRTALYAMIGTLIGIIISSLFYIRVGGVVAIEARNAIKGRALSDHRRVFEILRDTLIRDTYSIQCDSVEDHKVVERLCSDYERDTYNAVQDERACGSTQVGHKTSC